MGRAVGLHDTEIGRKRGGDRLETPHFFQRTVVQHREKTRVNAPREPIPVRIEERPTPLALAQQRHAGILAEPVGIAAPRRFKKFDRAQDARRIARSELRSPRRVAMVEFGMHVLA